ncbi:uncharacterized protein LOC115778428 [Archocentrus centrarchus]|uniref:uncharacterized protein LOC115778428 n=1 Tax=Archocentrus centrarchus TaxID=63155 RepID=UPI0011EA2EA2|nr:uncharacterized protein LOC115778428 [Archocentrus centrarchus]
MGALDLMHLKLPQVTPKFLGKVISSCMQDISDDEWMSLDASDTGSKAVTALSDMCCAVIGEISSLVLQDVEPQVLAWGHHHACGDNVTVPGGWSYCRVTEMNIRACCRNSLYDCFGEALHVAQESSHTLDQLVRLFSAEITKRVNSSLAQITGSAPSSDVYYWPTSECIFQMVSNMGNIFKSMLEGRRRVKGEPCDELPCLGCDCKQCCCFDFEGFEKRLAELLACMDNLNREPAPQMKDESCDKQPCSYCKSKECWCFDFEDLEKRLAASSVCMDNLNPEPAPQVSDHSESHDTLGSDMMDSSSSRSRSPDFQINQTFLTVLLGKLVDHIAVKTKTSILNMDLEQLVYGVTVRTEGVLNLAPPKNVAKLHIRMYKELCLKFRSKYVLQAVMESGDDTFEFAVSETLKSQLMKQKTKKRWRPFKSRNLPPGPEVQTPESQSEERGEQTSFSPPKRSLGRTVRKKLSRWGSNVVDFFNSRNSQT